MPTLPKIVAIVGPTASGKTALGVALAQRFSGEVVSADSRAIYQEMNLGTAKPTPDEQQGVTHHLIDSATLTQTYTLAQYQREAHQAITAILHRANLPIIVGGTGLYVNALLDNYTLPKALANPALRAKLTGQTAEKLYATLQKLDPETAAVIDRRNPRRLIRALEVKLTTGHSFTTQAKTAQPLYKPLVLGLAPNKRTLKERITKRVALQLEAGLEREVKALVAKYGWNSILANTIKYQEWRSYFENKITYSQLVSSLIKADVNYAKRQMTWFQKLKNVHWLTDAQQAPKLLVEFLKIK